MRNLLQVILGVLLALAFFAGHNLHTRVTKLEARAAEVEKSADAYKWLSESVVTLPDGRRVSRAQLLDILLAKAITPKK